MHADDVPPTNTLSGVWIAPSGVVWTAGGHGLVGRRTSSGWAWCSAATNVAFTSVWGTADDDVWFTGSNGSVLRWNGATFETLNTGTAADLSDIWGSGPDDVFVVGHQFFLHYDGIQWNNAGSAPGLLSAVWGSDADNVWVVGTHHVPSPTGDDYEDFCSNDIYRWDPATEQFALEENFGIYYGGCGLSGVGGSGPNDVWAVGDMFPAGAAAGFAFAAHYDGVSWTNATPPGDELSIDRVYTDVAAHAPGAESGAWIVAAGRGAIRWDGVNWSKAEEPLTSDLSAIDARGSSMFAVGRDNKVIRWNGTGWVNDR